MSLPRILFVGDGWLGSNARSMATGMRSVVPEVVTVDTTKVSRPRRLSPQWFYTRGVGKRFPRDVARVHQMIEKITRTWKPDVLFAFKTIHLDQQRLLDLNIPIKIHYSADDVSNLSNVTSSYLRYESEWDIIVTTKRYNLPELCARGVKNPLAVWSAYDPAWHHPVPRRRLEEYEVGFIGNMRPDRRDLIEAVARQFKHGMLITGPGWLRNAELHRSGCVIRNGAYGEEFSFSVASCQANLVLLNSDNRDTHTCRSFEVPASGGLFVGERTSEHEFLIEDGKCGFLFNGQDELFDVLSKVRENPLQAKRMAVRGQKAIVSGKNTYADRAAEILSFAGLL